MTGRPRILLVLTTLLALPLLTLHAQTRIDPKSPGWQWFPVIDTMYGIRQGPGRGVQFGREIHPVGDVSGDGIMDFVVNYLRTDTSFTVGGSTPYQRKPSELLLFRGVKGGMPSDDSGERIGLTEIGTDVKFLAAGDFDGDGNIDMAVETFLYSDTIRGGGQFGRVVIFWQDWTHRFSINDTTRLLSWGGVESWSGVLKGVAYDAEGNGTTDLLLYTDGWAVSNGYGVTVPPLLLYRGVRGERWGSNVLSRVPEWGEWSHVKFNTLGTPIDLDGDGSMDIPLILNMGGSPGSARVTVLYGRSGALPDTTDIETIDLDGAGGRLASFSDVTGDGLPELLVDCGLQEIIKIYAGRRGQRLIEQFGSGDDDPQPGKGWWRRPWAELWGANKLNDGFNGGTLLEFYDGNLDGINDIWLRSTPYTLCYVSGRWLDSLIDGFVELPAIGYRAWLGDIDSSGAGTFAMYVDNLQATVFFKATRNLPDWGVYRELPHETSGVEEVQGTGVAAEEMLTLEAGPNPATSEVRIRWSNSGSGMSRITVRDLLGREVAAWNVMSGQIEVLWQTGGIVGGVYFITLTAAESSRTIRVLVR